MAVASGIAVTATTGEAARAVPESGKETGWQAATRCGYTAGVCPGGVGAHGLPIDGGGIWPGGIWPSICCIGHVGCPGNCAESIWAGGI